MRLSNIAHLYVVRLKARVVLVQELFAIVGIAVGVALLFASQVAGTSLNGSVAQLDEGVVGQATYQLKARGPEGFSEAMIGKVERVPGVRSVVPALEQEITISGPNASEPVDLIATNPRDIHLTGRLLRRVAAAALINRRVLGVPAPIASRLRVGPLEVVHLQIGAHIAAALIGDELTARSIGPLVNDPIVLAPMAYAQQLTGLSGRITRLLVLTQPHMSRQVRKTLDSMAAGQVNVESATFESTLFSHAAAPVNQSTKTFAAICALVGFMFAYCAMLLTADARRNLGNELRHSGATRWETVKALLFDAFVLAAIGSLLGLAAGDALSLLIFRAPAGFTVLSFAFPVGSQRIVTVASVAIAVCAGTVAACAGALMPVLDWRALINRTRQTYRQRGAGGWTAVTAVGGCICLAITTVILALAPQSAVVGIGALIVALLLLLVPLLSLAIAGFDRFQRPMGRGATALATIELRSPAAKASSAAVAATAAIAVFGTVTIQGARANLQNGLDRSFHGIASMADLWIAPSGEQSLFATVPFPGISTSALMLPGIRAISPYRGSFLEYGDRQVWVLAPPDTTASPIPSSDLLGGNLRLARSRLRAGGWAAISKTLAEQHHLRVGQAFYLPTPRTTSFRVAALITNLGWPSGAIILNDKDYARAWQSADLGAYAVALAPGASPERIARELQARLTGERGLVVQTARQREQAQQRASRQGLDRLTQIALLALVSGILATATVMGAMILRRRGRFARMKVQGYGRGTLWAALLWEAALLIGAGCLLGAALGVYGQLLLSHALMAVTGFPVVVSANVLVALASCVLTTLVAAACVAVPGYRVASVAPYPWPDGWRHTGSTR